jgi:hypothetical protein
MRDFKIQYSDCITIKKMTVTMANDGAWVVFDLHQLVHIYKIHF